MTQQMIPTDDNLARAATYRFLSRLFAHELDNATFASIKKGEVRQLIDDLAQEKDLKDAAEWLTFNLDQRNDDSRSLMDLRVAFARLFLGAGGSKVAPPYASYYHNDRKSLNHPVVLEILDTYRQHGLVPDPDFTEPADHFSLLLGFMSNMALKDIPLNIQQDFIARYLAPVTVAFSADCSAHDPDGLYAASAQLLQAYVAKDLSIRH